MRISLLANPDNLHVQRWVNFLRARGHELLLVADPPTTHRPEGLKIEIPRWNLMTNIVAFRMTPAPHGNALWKFLHYRPILRRFRPDVVHGFEAYYNGLATAWAGPWPKVLTPWGNDIYHDGARGGLAGWMVRRALHGADRITTNDETLAPWLESRYGVSPSRVRAFSWGTDLTVFNADRRVGAKQWRERLKIEPEAPVIFSPRNFDPYWGGETIVEAIPGVLAGFSKAVFLFIPPSQDMDFLDRMKRRATVLGIDHAVRWLQRRVEPIEMADLFNLADLFISIPRTDLLAMTVLEGMACGSLPVLAPHRAYRKHARDGENALILPEISPPALCEAVMRALRDPELRERARRINPERMTLEENAAVNMLEIEEVYAEAIERFRSGS